MKHYLHICWMRETENFEWGTFTMMKPLLVLRWFPFRSFRIGRLDIACHQY